MLSAAPKPLSLRMSYRQWSRWDSGKAHPASGTSRPYRLSPTCTFTTPVVKWVEIFIYSTYRQLILSWSHDVNTFSEHFLINSLGFSFLASNRGQGQEKKILSWSAFKKCLTGVKNLPFVHPDKVFATIKNLVCKGNNASWKGSSSFNLLGDTRMASKEFFGEFRIFARRDNIDAITLKIFTVTNRRTWLCSTNQ